MMHRQGQTFASRLRCSRRRVLLAPPAQALDTITAGSVGSASTTIWPSYIGIQKGFFDAAGIKLDPVVCASPIHGDRSRSRPAPPT